MPVYEYICPRCKTEFELRLSFAEFDSTGLCPHCYSDARRLTPSFACKTGSNLQAAEKPFRGRTLQEWEVRIPGVLITPPPDQVKFLASPSKKSSRTSHKIK